MIEPGQAVLQILGGLLLADFITGVFHWAEDAYCIPSLPILGPHVCGPNIRHHADPSRFARTSWWRRNQQPLVLTAIGALGLIAWWPAVFAGPLWLTCFAMLAVSNEVHAWSHRRPKLKVIRLLQAMAILQRPEQHADHHRPPYDRCYCVLTNWLNPPLDLVGFWRWLEWLAARCGISVQRGGVSREGY